MPPKKEPEPVPEPVPAVLEPADFAAAVAEGLESGSGVERKKEELKRLQGIPGEERRA